MKRPSKNTKLPKGMSSAVLLSILIHAALFLLAGVLVVFTVVKKDEQKFEQPVPVERPKMKLKKPKPRIKKSARPKQAKHILAKVKPVNMPEIQLPELSGMDGDGGLGGGIGGGFDTLPDLGEITIFGGGQTIGNDFEGSLYNFNRDRNGRKIPMDGDTFRQKLRDFVLSGWKTRKISRYYRLPKKFYTTHFMVPEIPASMGPDAFGAPEMEGYYFMLHYKGQLVSQEPITFRFCGIGNAYMMIRVDGKEVFLACWNQHRAYFDWWDSNSADDWKYYLGKQRMTVGDWITLEPGTPLDMEVMFGEWKGGTFSAMLNVEVSGVEYERNKQGGPVLPAFKTAEFSPDLLDEIYPHLSENETCLTNRLVFRDYSVSDETSGKDTSEMAESSVTQSTPTGDMEMREWTLANGRSFEAELVAVIGRKVSLKTRRGKTIWIPQERLSLEDLKFIQLENPPEFDISFSKQSEQRTFPDPLPGWPSTQPQPKAFRYVFSANVKQVSAGSYDQELHAEFFTIGAEINGDRYILLDRQTASFTPDEENNRSIRFSGRTVELPDFLVGGNTAGWDRRGRKYSSFLVVVTDSRGKLIAHETPKKWLFENLENLKKVPVGKYFDKTCTRTRPTRPKTRYY